MKQDEPPLARDAPAAARRIATVARRCAPALRRLWHALTRATAIAWILTASGAVILQVVNLEGNRDVILFESCTPYVFVPGYALLVAALLRRHRLVASATAALLLFQLVTTLPHLVAHSGSASDIAAAPRVRIFDQNVQGASNDAVPLTGESIRAERADIVVLEEVTSGFLASLHATGALQPYPNTFRDGDRAVFSTAPLVAPEPVGTGRSWSDRMGVTFRGRAMTLYMVHMPAPLFEAPDTWNGAFAALRNDLDRSSGPVLLIGDFNATMSHHALRDLVGSGYGEVSTELGQPLARTWPAKDGPAAWLGGVIRIDHALIRGVTPVSIAEGFANRSDHRSLLVELALTP